MELRPTLPISTILAAGHLSRRPRRPSFHCSPVRTLHGEARSSHAPRSSSLPWPSPSDLTPYNILGLQPGDPYNKGTFYDLDKIYHPDRYQTVPSDLPPTIREHRYRLVVAAHELLSNPHKRLTYDHYGVGWGGAHGRGPPRAAGVSRYDHHNTSHESSAREADIFVPHPRLVVLLLVIAFFLQSCLFVVQAQKAEIHARQLHEQSQRLLDRRRSRAAGLRALAAQFERFLLKRDPTGLGLTRREETTYREILPYCAYDGS
ncbi:hypothetical protein BO78DRAFT_420394 [Aspergillus sclerotiicarbonarius CBS 121057]|uniref:J domain-containing protein n=1 Tax=Aspergillus sclerotiicarbonarius (strain CBS 121057 / IBT 28362) TaxID=1448318 RepID=A0A319E5N8_ASPSB|nr:hypothetical protein BO78DRAFT_420394 [Aspergillus sclerotiicarbonarius CBS 121057]